MWAPFFLSGRTSVERMSVGLDPSIFPESVFGLELFFRASPDRTLAHARASERNLIAFWHVVTQGGGPGLHSKVTDGTATFNRMLKIRLNS